jgi:homoserine O-acetyltransferase/O-succinyltransferase
MKVLSNHFRSLLCTLAIVLLAVSQIADARASELQANSKQSEATLRLNITQHDAVYRDYFLSDGGRLPEARIHYATLGSPHRNASGQIDNAVLLLHWTGASGKALQSEEFQKALYAPGAPLDASRYFLIIPDNLGHGASTKPSDGLKAKFPQYGYSDLVTLQHKLVTETLGIERLHAIVGLSMGGMNAWEWAERYPAATDGIMPVVALPVRIAGRNLLWRAMAAKWIQEDPAYDHGNYTAQPRGLALSSELARLMIEGVPHFQQIIPDVSAAQQFLSAVDQQSASSDANDLLYSLLSSRDYSPEGRLSEVRTKVYALNFDDDEFNPVGLGILQRTVTQVPNARYAVQPGTPESHGHLTMAHPGLWANQVAIFMKSIEPQK